MNFTCEPIKQVEEVWKSVFWSAETKTWGYIWRWHGCCFSFAKARNDTQTWTYRFSNYTWRWKHDAVGLFQSVGSYNVWKFGSNLAFDKVTVENDLNHTFKLVQNFFGTQQNEGPGVVGVWLFWHLPRLTLSKQVNWKRTTKILCNCLTSA